MMNESKIEVVHHRAGSHDIDDEEQQQLLVAAEPSSNGHSLETTATVSHSDAAKARRAEVLQFLYGAGGIWAAYLYYGSLQEDVFRYKSPNGEAFTYAWFLQFLEALANVIVGFVGRKITGGVPNLPRKFFYITGATQVCSKAFTSLALASGLSFPAATLAKSGKMAPVMMGQLILGGASYSLRDYLQVLAIIGGTAMLSLAKKKGGESQSTPLGLMFILLSLAMDGVTGGLQKKLKEDMGRRNMHPKPYDFMFYTSVSMMTVALVVSSLKGEFVEGWEFCVRYPQIMRQVIQFSLCSAIGSSFIFYTVAHFDPLVCSTVTTTRKIASVLLSILLKGHHLSGQAWAGVSLAICGIMSEVHSKCMGKSPKKKIKAKESGI